MIDKKVIVCPGQYHIGGTLVATSMYEGARGKTGECDFCGQRVNLDPITNAPLRHRVTITIHADQNGA